MMRTIGKAHRHTHVYVCVCAMYVQAHNVYRSVQKTQVCTLTML